MQARTLTQERDQERLLLESVASTRDEQHQQLHDTLAEHLQHYEEEEQKYAEDWQILRTEWDTWSEDQTAESAAATQQPAPLPASSSVAEQQPTQFQPWTPPPLPMSPAVERMVKGLKKEPSGIPYWTTSFESYSSTTALHQLRQGTALTTSTVLKSEGRPHFQPPTPGHSSSTWPVQPAAEGFMMRPTPAGTQQLQEELPTETGRVCPNSR